MIKTFKTQLATFQARKNFGTLIRIGIWSLQRELIILGFDSCQGGEKVLKAKVLHSRNCTLYNVVISHSKCE